MAILIIDGPQRGPASPRLAEGWNELRRRARAGGQDLWLRRCVSLRALTACLQRSRRAPVQMVLLESGDLDDGECVRQAHALRLAIDALPTPYIEVHDDSGQLLEPRLHPRQAPLATVVMHRDRAQARTLALSIALACLANPPVPREVWEA